MKAKKIFAGLICILVILMLVIIGLVLSESNAEPKELVNKETSENSESALFIINKVRYPAKAKTIPIDPKNNTINVGVSPETYELNFGIVPQNITIRKFINLQNNEDSRVKVCAVTYGDIKPMVSIDYGETVLDSTGSNVVEITFNATQIGNYAGEIDIISKKPKYSVLDFLLPLVKC